MDLHLHRVHFLVYSAMHRHSGTVLVEQSSEHQVVPLHQFIGGEVVQRSKVAAQLGRSQVGRKVVG